MSLADRLFEAGGLAAGAFVAGGLAPTAAAAPIPIVNPGFGEVTDPGTGEVIPLIPGDYTSGFLTTVINQFRENRPAIVAGWSAAGQDFAEGVENAGNSLPGGTHAYLNPDGAFEQELSRPVEAGTYVLAARVGDRADTPDRPFAAPTMELFEAESGNALAPTTSLNPTPPNGGYVTWTQTYVIPAGLPNTEIGIRFISGGDESHIDDVVLDFVPIPEPGTPGILGIAGAALLARRRRRG